MKQNKPVIGPATGTDFSWIGPWSQKAKKTPQYNFTTNFISFVCFINSCTVDNTSALEGRKHFLGFFFIVIQDCLFPYSVLSKIKEHFNNKKIHKAPSFLLSQLFQKAYLIFST